ncbi:prostatic spermine-binding protein-like isoform X2 [Stylophora pistillata]|uniref:Uncharacterized protein n=1 Tax=Stylophora pistillata TaxID=50429 RepID=A0A2B4S4H6_STYPI|nr:prostatic spermine-binding protein-like isoform X2 [Stylophora pistillata]PFX23953.1 hypothetical protein AWC38_SpisGene11464 [Stylophora pistillata]
MKLLILCLLVFTSVCFVFGDEEEIKPNFVDLDENDDQVSDESPEEFKDEGDNYMLDEEDLDEEDDSEPGDPDGFKDDDNDPNSTKAKGRKPDVKAKIDEIGKPGTGEPTGSGEPGSNMKENQSAEGKQDENLKDAVEDKLGLNSAGESDDPDFVTKK